MQTNQNECSYLALPSSADFSSRPAILTSFHLSLSLLVSSYHKSNSLLTYLSHERLRTGNHKSIYILLQKNGKVWIRRKLLFQDTRSRGYWRSYSNSTGSEKNKFKYLSIVRYSHAIFVANEKQYKLTKLKKFVRLSWFFVKRAYIKLC